ncbi:MAG: hypothetical protein GXY48_11170 [Methanomicrobiales archaeon]|nr:hypothetical protein [Methanomicrobiales archaeon]
MKQFRAGLIFSFLLLILIPGIVLGYIIEIDAPKTIVKGTPLTVTGSTTFPEDTYFDILLYYAKYTSQEVGRIRVIVDATQLFRADFDTRHLEKGQYKVEVHNIISDNELFVEQQLGSASTTRRIIQITDRSDEIQITSPDTQPQDQALTISGRMRDMGDGVITLRVFGPDHFTYGPEQMITKKGYTDNSGEFSTSLPVPMPGTYQASMSDKKGFIGEYEFVVTVVTPKETIAPIRVITTEPTPDQVNLTTPLKTPVPATPTPTQSPIGITSLIVSILGTIMIFSGNIRR